MECAIGYPNTMGRLVVIIHTHLGEHLQYAWRSTLDVSGITVSVDIFANDASLQNRYRDSIERIQMSFK
jgi:hypothetical protein